jgi:hypothetical protein
MWSKQVSINFALLDVFKADLGYIAANQRLENVFWKNAMLLAHQVALPITATLPQNYESKRPKY